MWIALDLSANNGHSHLEMWMHRFEKISQNGRLIITLETETGIKCKLAAVLTRSVSKTFKVLLLIGCSCSIMMFQLLDAQIEISFITKQIIVLPIWKVFLLMFSSLLRTSVLFDVTFIMLMWIDGLFLLSTHSYFLKFFFCFVI